MKTSLGPHVTQPAPEQIRNRHDRTRSDLASLRPAIREAKIVYTPTKITIRPNASYNLDLNNDGVTHFTISTSYARTKGDGLSERDC